MSRVKKVGYAVVGLGAIAEGSVLPAFAHAKHARLVALVSRDKKKATELARKFHARIAYGSDEYAGCLSNPDISAIYVATPPGEHASFAIRAADAQKHVLCEKPLAATANQSRRMVEAHGRNGTLLMTAYRKYFEPSCLYVKRLIEGGDLGEIDVIHAAFNELYVPGISPSWLVDRKLAGGGPLMDLGIYCVNTTRWLITDNPVRATAFAWRHNRTKVRDVEEGIEFRLEFPSGTIVQASTTYSSVLSSFISVQGTKGWLLLAPAFPFSEGRRLTGRIGTRVIHRRFKVSDEFAPELDHLALAIRRKQPVVPDGQEGHSDMIILQAIYESARTRETVSIRYN